MKFKFLILLVIAIFFSGCTTTKISKTSFREDILHSIDFYEVWKQERHPGSEAVSIPCFDIEEDEFREAVNTYGVECWERELENAPDMLSDSDLESLQPSVANCVETKILKRFKEDFTFDKSPEYLEHCKKIYQKLKRLR